LWWIVPFIDSSPTFALVFGTHPPLTALFSLISLDPCQPSHDFRPPNSMRKLSVCLDPVALVSVKFTAFRKPSPPLYPPRIEHGSHPPQRFSIPPFISPFLVSAIERLDPPPNPHICSVLLGLGAFEPPPSHLPGKPSIFFLPRLNTPVCFKPPPNFVRSLRESPRLSPRFFCDARVSAHHPEAPPDCFSGHFPSQFIDQCQNDSKRTRSSFYPHVSLVQSLDQRLTPLARGVLL